MWKHLRFARWKFSHISLERFEDDCHSPPEVCCQEADWLILPISTNLGDSSGRNYINGMHIPVLQIVVTKLGQTLFLAVCSRCRCQSLLHSKRSRNPPWVSHYLFSHQIAITNPLRGNLNQKNTRIFKSVVFSASMNKLLFQDLTRVCEGRTDIHDDSYEGPDIYFCGCEIWVQGTIVW